jgi:flavin-dependent dehydrogenase
MASIRRPHVLILGAGLGGLLLAQSLRKQNIPFDIFDRDDSLHSRSQGWCIGIHGFFDDLETAMPDDLPAIELTSHLRPLDLPAQLCFFRGANKFFVESGHEGRVIRAHRARLRDWLATNIRVNWKSKAIRIEKEGDSIKLHFADGSSATGDVLVGADGVNSMGESRLLLSQPCADRSQSAPTSSKSKPPFKPFPKVLSSRKLPSTNRNSIANSRSRIPPTSRWETASSRSSVSNPSTMTPSPPYTIGS